MNHNLPARPSISAASLGEDERRHQKGDRDFLAMN